ncbi:helix-turn-helix domain-containing protein [Streptomyces sp. NPDC006283]|uniref:helix-turn-helix domain-containing protein n=1 Tax=Streptomyces sp. NPDC006283 TaxID=3156741 RepID=UPI0033B35F82
MIRHRCRITNCPRTPQDGRTLCDTHRGRLYRHGNPHQPHTPTDQHAIEAAVSNRRTLPGLRPAERRAAGLTLSALGLPASEIARIFSVTPRTVYRWRSQTTNAA